MGTPHAELIGRHDELDRARIALRTGSGLVVVGEAGAGKTALISAALDDIAVRAGQCFRSLAWTPAVPLEQAIGRSVPAGDAAWAAQAVTTGCRGAVLRLDDLQWADPLTLDVLRLLPPQARVAITVRSGDPGTAAALEVLAQRGVLGIELPALPLADATELAQRRFPRMRPAAAQRLAARCGGNPLLIEELGADDEPSSGLRRAVIGRVRRLGEAAWQGFAMLSSAGEPLPASWLPDVAVLVDAGLVVTSGAGDGVTVSPRHPLLAEAVAHELHDGPAERRIAVQLAVADLAERAGQLPLAARCCVDAGVPERARTTALAAAEGAERPGERAGLLFLAASAADADIAADLSARAVAELVDAGEYAQAAALIDLAVAQEDANWWGLVGRVRWQQGDDAAALAAFERGLALAVPDSAESVLLQAEHARAVLLGLGDVQRALTLATAAHANAMRTGLHRGRALAVLGTAEHISGDELGNTHLAEAIELAAAEHDLMVEFTSANNLAAAFEGTGHLQAAIDLANRFAARAEELHLLGWQQQMRAMAYNAQMHLGVYDDILADIPVLVAGALDRRTRDQLEATLALALIDTGRTDEAVDRTTLALRTAAADHFGRGSLHYARSEARLWSGDPGAALDDARIALELSPSNDNQLFPLLTIAHALTRLGEPIDLQWPAADLRVVAGAPDELAGLVALAAGDRSRAAASFASALALWRGQHRRAELRCRWLVADVAADAEQARTQLLALEQELSALGWAPLLGQVRRSLRGRGVRSAAPRGRVGELTAREREVLDLVAQGLSTAAVAARLGLSPATVAAQIASARNRLGAHTRWQAASG